MSRQGWPPRPLHGLIRGKVRVGTTTVRPAAWAQIPAAAWVEDYRHGLAPFDGTWVVPITGLYRVDAALATNLSSRRGMLAMNVNTTTAAGFVLGGSSLIPSSWTIPSFGGDVDLTAGDVLRLWAYFDVAGNAQGEPHSAWSIRALDVG